MCVVQAVTSKMGVLNSVCLPGSDLHRNASSVRIWHLFVAQELSVALSHVSVVKFHCLTLSASRRLSHAACLTPSVSRCLFQAVCLTLSVSRCLSHAVSSLPICCITCCLYLIFLTFSIHAPLDIPKYGHSYNYCWNLANVSLPFTNFLKFLPLSLFCKSAILTMFEAMCPISQIFTVRSH